MVHNGLHVRSALGPELKMIYLNMSETRLREHLIERTRGNMTATNAFMVQLNIIVMFLVSNVCTFPELSQCEQSSRY